MRRWISQIMIALTGSYVATVALAQAPDPDRGAAVFSEHCTRCHIPIEIRQRLQDDWQGQTAGALLERIRNTMPGEQPGSLSAQDYLDVTYHTLRLGGAALPGQTPDAGDLAALTIRSETSTTENAQETPWTHFNGGSRAQRYSALGDIDADNVDQLEVAWRWRSAGFGPSPEGLGVVSPLMADGRVYTTAGVTRNVVAVDAGTGQILWLWRPREGERFDRAPRKGSGKGLELWQDEDRDVIFTVTPGYYLVALNARTGLPVEDFGAGGWVDLMEGLRPGPGRDDMDIGLSFPPLVVDDVVVVGASHALAIRPPDYANVKGDIRGFDARTGELLWTFKTIPAPGEAGHDTWQEGSAEYTGNAGVWAPMSADPELGLVYLPVETATGDYYGGHRPGDNLFANSLVALDYRTGERVWHYQIVHHDIWDWDLPAAPILADLPDGRKVVVQLTKQAMAYVFDRETGEPVWPIEETPVPESDVPGEWTSPTQPIPGRPAPFDRQGMSEVELIDFTPELRARAEDIAADYRLGELFTPPSLANASDGTKGTLHLPHATGGANWEGGAYDPETGLLYVPSRSAVGLLALVPGGEDSTMDYIQGPFADPTVDGLPLIRPPWGRITAIDLNNGEHRWWIPNADTPEEVRNHPALEGVDLPRTGNPNRVPILLTDTLLFAGEGPGGKPLLRAHDKETGDIIAEIDMPGTVTGIPITFEHHGEQYVVMAVSGEGAWELVALKLPKS